MKKRLAAILLMLLLATLWLPALADTITVTYSIFDAIIPFKNMVDCQRTTYTTVNKMQQLNQFTYVFAADEDAQIHNLVPDVITNPDDYYYKFSEDSEDDSNIKLTMYKHSEPSYSYTLSSNGYIQTYGDNCFLYVGVGYKNYGCFVSFRKKNYHMCADHTTHSANYSHENVNQIDSDRKDCILCGCGETFIIRGYNPSVSVLKTLPMVEGLVEIEHEHQYGDNGKCLFCDETNTYAVTLYTNGGTVNGNSVTSYTYGVGATLPTDVTKDGYAFVGWYDNPDFNGTAVKAISKTDIGEKTFYAKWVEYDKLIHKTEVSLSFTEIFIPENMPEDVDTVDEIEDVITEKLSKLGLVDPNTLLCDATLSYSGDGGKTWQKATPEHFPAGGRLTVTMPVPEGTHPDKHVYTVVHMFTTDAFGKKAGDVEVPAVTIVRDEKGNPMLSFEVTGLSPIMVAWTEKPDSGVLPQTGDSSNLALWLMLMGLAGAGMYLLRKRAYN